MSETVMGHAENPMRLRMEEAARLAGLKYIVNVVSDVTGRIVGCFTGDMVAAHRAGCKLSYRVHAVHLPGRADIVLTDAHPADRDFWQSAKGMYSGTMAVRRGGSLINVAPNPEGVADNHPNLLELGYRSHAEIINLVERGEIHDVVGAAILGDVAQIIDHADCIMVSPGVDRQDTERLGMRYAATAQEALDMAFAKQGEQARVAVLRYGGHVLPLADVNGG
jgi:nickel-dependent lactate racemase